ncbi:ubiquitin-like protein Pup [Bifidobacterium magnum]|uniref:Prokaryotic ubiquitin-like protein Pup n=1 Tax=Bifidobacterium magnum TaxID=1692 RepID=A0A087BCP3_9BIFI|nr:ubiquitin-like protein Pup [Bifidobacterium magnum]KFI68793.1 Pup-like protein [Bifidobacterium magnum]
MPQEQVTGHESSQQQAKDDETVLAAPVMQAQEDIDELDAVLQDIEAVLETNAQTYIDSFVQKGGQ